jgi:hypothetical protein
MDYGFPGVGARVDILLGNERLIGALQRMTVLYGRGATYDITGHHNGWEFQATATELFARGEGADGTPTFYTAHGAVTITLTSPSERSADELAEEEQIEREAFDVETQDWRPVSTPPACVHDWRQVELDAQECQQCGAIRQRSADDGEATQ